MGATAGDICLGCMNFGTRVAEEAAFAVLDRYVQRGGTFLDTADNYSFWEPDGTGDESEALLGRWLAGRDCRDEVFLATKLGARPTVPGTGFETAEGLSGPAIAAAVDGSLGRLGTDRVDLLYAHVDDRSTPQRETLAAFTEVVRAGHAGEVGASNHRAWRLALAQDLADREGLVRYGWVQQRWSYLQPRPGADLDVQVAVDDELLDLCRANGTVVLAYSPLLSGAYVRPEVPLNPEYRTADNARRLDVLARIAAETTATPNQIVLASLRQTPGVRVIPVMAASSPAQLDESLDALDLELDAAQLEALATAPAA